MMNALILLLIFCRSLFCTFDCDAKIEYVHKYVSKIIEAQSARFFFALWLLRGSLFAELIYDLISTHHARSRQRRPGRLFGKRMKDAIMFSLCKCLGDNHQRETRKRNELL